MCSRLLVRPAATMRPAPRSFAILTAVTSHHTTCADRRLSRVRAKHEILIFLCLNLRTPFNIHSYVRQAWQGFWLVFGTSPPFSHKIRFPLDFSFLIGHNSPATSSPNYAALFWSMVPNPDR
jgi:hypothetical protein